MTELRDFLLARIDEDENAARTFIAHTQGPDYGIWGRDVDSPDDGDVAAAFEGPGKPADPERVLIDCQAKRRLIAQVCDVEWGGYAVRDEVLECLAQPYSNHGDYPLDRTGI